MPRPAKSAADKTREAKPAADHTEVPTARERRRAQSAPLAEPAPASAATRKANAKREATPKGTAKKDAAGKSKSTKSAAKSAKPVVDITHRTGLEAPSTLRGTTYRDVEIRAPRGVEKSCKTWQAEAAMRMLMNNLDPEVAENPKELVVYGGIGQAARNWECFDAIVRELQQLGKEETLLVQSGKPVAVFRTHKDAPRVLLANSNLVGNWANWEHFNSLRERGLMMFGQMTAGSWIYIGTQGILQGTYETLCSAGETHFGGRDLQGRLFVTGGLGGMGGAQPLAMSMAGGVTLAADVDRSRIEFRLRTRYLDELVEDLDEAIDRACSYADDGIGRSVGWCGNAVTLLERLLELQVVPDLLSDQTSAHDPLNGYVPVGLGLKEALALRAADPTIYVERSYEGMARHVRAMLALQKMGAHTFDYGNNLRGYAKDKGGVENAFDFPGFVQAYIRPQFCRGRGPFRWCALSGDPQDIYTTDQALIEAFPHDTSLHTWLRKARERIQFQGLPCRICWLGYGERAKAGKIFNRLVAEGKVSAPLVIGRDHLDCGSVASPNRETEAMKDGTDAVADWPILNALINTACGASWVSFHHGGGVGMGYSLHAGQVIVADGTKAAGRRLKRVLTADPGMGVARHIDAGYDEAKIFNEGMGSKAVQIPM